MNKIKKYRLKYYINQSIISVLIGIIASYLLLAIVEEFYVSSILFLLSFICLIFSLTKYTQLRKKVTNLSIIKAQRILINEYEQMTDKIIKKYTNKENPKSEESKERTMKSLVHVQVNAEQKIFEENENKKSLKQLEWTFWLSVVFMLIGTIFIIYPPILVSNEKRKIQFKDEHTGKEGDLIYNENNYYMNMNSDSIFTK